MRKGHSLLTRIRNPEFAVARRAISDVETRDSVLRHLKVICETRAGTMLTAPDYGTATVSEMARIRRTAIERILNMRRTEAPQGEAPSQISSIV